MFSTFKIYLCIGATKYLNDTKRLVSSEATLLQVFMILPLMFYVNIKYTQMVTYTFYADIFSPNNIV